ncbi:hypothetical protein PIB30_055539 [Stylosanthes scabra]|uniref:Uncharacterized protein n=1 Tax=Stylosanthes scabra TaxID=79078 RepID=A0ABU6TIX6_9FABA|nr:hypothetical protein [Stylosanthes scabra]
MAASRCGFGVVAGALEWIVRGIAVLTDRHGEASLEIGNSSGLSGYWQGYDEQGGDTWEENAARYQSMVVDAFPHQYAWMDDQSAEDSEEEPNPEAKLKSSLNSLASL